jgi:hypothetical protein
MFTGLMSRWNPGGVRRRQTISDTDEEFDDLPPGSAAGGSPVRKRSAVYELRAQIQQAVDVPCFVHCQDVRVVERGCGGRFLLKPSANRCVGERVAKDLDRNRPIQSRITCPIHLAHATRSEQAFDLVRAQAGTTVQGHSRGDVTPQPVVTPPI